MSARERERDVFLQHALQDCRDDCRNEQQIMNGVQMTLMLVQVKDKTVGSEHLGQPDRIDRQHTSYAKILSKMECGEYAIHTHDELGNNLMFALSSCKKSTSESI